MLIRLSSYILVTFILISTTLCQKYRTINGTNNNANNPNAGVPVIPFVRNAPSISYFADANNNLIQTPGNYTIFDIPFTCAAAALPDGVFPLPRCVSNMIMSKQSKDDDMFNVQKLEKFKSKRKTSHIVSVFLYFLIFVPWQLCCGGAELF